MHPLALAQERSTHRETIITQTPHRALTAAEVDRARAWSLNETEWRRYQRLMQGIRGSVSPATLSPIEVLGIHARDAAERRDYAKRWAVALHEDAERVLAFQRAYSEAAQRLYPGQRLIDTARLDSRPAQTTHLQAGDRILLQVGLDCPSCDAALAKALTRLDVVAGIDIYVSGVDTSAQDGIRRWAMAQGIRSEWVQSRRVTLNVGSVSETSNTRALPMMYVRRGQDVAPLAYAAL